MNTTQINFRIPLELKQLAQLKAEKYGTNLNFLMRLFLTKFIQWDNIVTFTQEIDMEKIFDEGVISYLSSNQGKQQIKKINTMLTEIVDNPEEEKKYLV